MCIGGRVLNAFFILIMLANEIFDSFFDMMDSLCSTSINSLLSRESALAKYFSAIS